MTSVSLTVVLLVCTQVPADGPPLEKVRAAVKAARQREQQPLLDAIEQKNKLIEGVNKGYVTVEPLSDNPSVREQQEFNRRSQLIGREVDLAFDAKWGTKFSQPSKSRKPARTKGNSLSKKQQQAILESEIADIEEQIKVVNQRVHLPMVPLDFDTLDIGSFGTLELTENNRLFVRVLQVIGDDEFLGTIGDAESMRKEKERLAKRKSMGIKETTKIVDASFPYWFRGVSTSSLVDGKATELSGQFYVPGKATYTSGNKTSRTAFVISPINTKLYEDAIRSSRDTHDEKNHGFAKDPTDGAPAEKVRAAIETARKIEQQPMLDSIDVRKKLIEAVRNGTASIEAHGDRRSELQHPTDPKSRKTTRKVQIPGSPNSPRWQTVPIKPLSQKEQVEILEVEIDEIQHKLDPLQRAGHVPLLPLDFRKLDLGSFGTLERPFVRVVQVLNDDEFLGTIGDYASMRKQEDAIERNKTRGVESKTKVIDATIPYLFRGISTSALVDGKALKLTGAFQVAGKETYATAGGTSRTVFVLSPLDIKRYVKEAAGLRTAVPDTPVVQEPTPKAKPARPKSKNKHKNDADDLMNRPLPGIK